MKSSSNQKRKSVKKSESFQRFNIQEMISSQRSPHKSMIFERVIPSSLPQTLIKKNRFLIELPKIYPIHKKLMNLKPKDMDLLKMNDRRFHLRGYKYANQMEQSTDSTLEMEQLKKSQLSIPSKQSSSSSNNSFSETILRINNINHLEPIKNNKLKVFVEEGNNSRLIKQLLRKRPQLKFVQSKNQADFIWTRFSDYEAIQKYSKLSQKIEKNQYVFTKSQDNFHEAFRKIVDPEIHNSIKNPTKSIEIVNFFMHNHLKNHEQISDKKNLFKNIRNYCKSHRIDQNTLIPKTFHVDVSKLKEQEKEVKIGQIFNDKLFNENSFFVVKPGQDTNRGEGISVVQGKSNLIHAVKQLQKKGKSSLIQQYINPLLYKNRKFDIRCYVLVTSIAGELHAYWYKEGYLRTCCKQFSYDPSNIYGHLTNDAVQKKHKDYGKFQQANKLSFNDLQTILGQTEKTRDDVIKEMKVLAKHSIKSVQNKLRGQKNTLGFQIFGYDFLIDKEGKVWLIEVNTNPCLQFAGSLLSRIIWHMVDNSFRIALDPYLDPQVKKQYHNYFQLNKYECII